MPTRLNKEQEDKVLHEFICPNCGEFLMCYDEWEGDIESAFVKLECKNCGKSVSIVYNFSHVELNDDKDIIKDLIKKLKEN